MTSVFPAPNRRGFLLIVAAVAMTFGNAVHEGFHFDDEHSLVANPHIRQLAKVPDFFSDPQLFSRNTGSEMYRPLVLLSYAVTYHFFDYSAQAYHLFNIGVHLSVALAVYLLYLRLGLQNTTALFGAVLFAVHPLAGEPVNYISSRSESLAALFFMAALLFYVTDSDRAWLAAIICYPLALMCKSSAIVLPAVLLAYELLLKGGKIGRGWWRRMLPFWGVAGLYLYGVWRLVDEAVVTAPVRDWHQQFSTQGKALVYYAKLLAFPRPLTVEHQFFAAESWLDSAVVLSLLFLLSLIYALWHGRRLRPVVFWIACMAVVLLPTLVVPLNVLVNERRLYLPMVAVIGAGLYLLEASGWRLRWNVGAVVLVAGLAGLAHQRNDIWRDEKSLWQDARDKARLMVRPHVKLGAIYRSEGDWTSAAAAYSQALTLDPDYAPAHNNMGNLYRDRGDLQAAEKAYRRSLSLLPNYPDALVNLATLLSDMGRSGEALQLYRQALDIGGQRVEIYNNLGTAYLKIAEYELAEMVLRRGLAFGLERPGLYFNLGGALEGQGKVGEAAAVYGHAIALDSTYARAYYNLALLHEQAFALEQAVAAYRAFLRHWRGDPRFRSEAERRLQGLLVAGGLR